MASSARVVGSLNFVFWHSITSTRAAVDIDMRLRSEKTGAGIISTDGLSRGDSRSGIKSSVSIATGEGVRIMASARISAVKIGIKQTYPRRVR